MSVPDSDRGAFKPLSYDKLPSLPSANPSLGSKKELKEAKEKAKKAAYEAALNTTSGEAPVTVPKLSLPEAAGAPPETTEDQKPAETEPELVRESDPTQDSNQEEQPDIIYDDAYLEEAKRCWTYDRLVEYITENNLLLSPDDKIAARSHLADKKKMSTFLDKLEAVEQGGEMPTDEEIAEAEEIAERKGKSIIDPEDWSKDNFLEVIGLVSSKDGEGPASQSEKESEEEIMRRMEALDLAVTSSAADLTDRAKTPQPIEALDLKARFGKGVGFSNGGMKEMPTLDVVAVDEYEASASKEAICGEEEIGAKESTENTSLEPGDETKEEFFTLQPAADGRRSLDQRNPSSIKLEMQTKSWRLSGCKGSPEIFTIH